MPSRTLTGSHTDWARPRHFQWGPKPLRKKNHLKTYWFSSEISLYFKPKSSFFLKKKIKLHLQIKKKTPRWNKKELSWRKMFCYKAEVGRSWPLPTACSVCALFKRSQRRLHLHRKQWPMQLQLQSYKGISYLICMCKNFNSSCKAVTGTFFKKIWAKCAHTETNV